MSESDVQLEAAVSTAATTVAATNAWRKHSFYIEMKPRGDYASLFIDCPPNGADDTTTSNRAIDAEFVRVSNNSLEVVEDINCDNVSLCPATLTQRAKYVASFVDLALVPNSLCALSWADRCNRLFMCKIRAETDESVLFFRKTFRNFEEELRQRSPIRDCVNEIRQSGGLLVLCRQCQSTLYSHLNNDIEFETLPDDDWWDTSPSMEYFCGQACGGGHGLDRHCHVTAHYSHESILGISTSETSVTKWLPSAQKIVFTDSFLMFLENDALQCTIKRNEGSCFLTCAQCQSQIGMTLKRNNCIYKLHVGAVEVYGVSAENVYPNAKDYIFLRFQSLERYFAWMFLYKSESQSSMKLLIRTYEQKPFMLVWLLEPYVIMTKGVLKRQESSDLGIENDEIRLMPSSDERQSLCEYEHQSFPALKILYKIYDEESASSDPRANGGDSSVGIADIPSGCGLQLAEILLQSTHSLPPSLRAVGQLYVGYFRLNECAK